MPAGLAHAEQLPPHGQAWPAYGGLAALDAAHDVTEHSAGGVTDVSTGGKDWPIALAIFGPVGAAYAVIGYALWVVSGVVS